MKQLNCQRYWEDLVLSKLKRNLSLTTLPHSLLVGAPTTDLLLCIFPLLTDEKFSRVATALRDWEMALSIPAWITNVCQFFLEKPIAIFQRHLMCILFSQHTILKHSAIRTTNLPFTYSLLQVSVLPSSFKDDCFPFPTLSSKSVSTHTNASSDICLPYSHPGLISRKDQSCTPTP